MPIHQSFKHFLQSDWPLLILIALLPWSLSGCALKELPANFFQESFNDTPNPGRGFYDQLLLGDLVDFSFENSKLQNHRLLIQLNHYLDREIPEENLAAFERSLARVKSQGHHLIIRFLYDWPTTAVYSSNRKLRQPNTPNAEIILRHIEQLARILARQHKSIIAIESGMIGFWGEQHGDSEHKQRPEFLASIVDAWLQGTIGTNIFVLVRSPTVLRDILFSHGNYSTRLHNYVRAWNDCLGAFNDPNMPKGTPLDVFTLEGETCQLPPKINYGCRAMTDYLESIRLSLLHMNYYQPTIDLWKQEGCWDTIQMRLGYRFVIRRADFSRDRATLSLRIDNVGWGYALASQPLFVNINGYRRVRLFDLSSIAPSSFFEGTFNLSFPVDSSARIWLETEDEVQFSNVHGNFLN